MYTLGVRINNDYKENPNCSISVLGSSVFLCLNDIDNCPY